MTLPILLAVIVLCTGLASAVGTRALIPFLRWGRFVDQPNERSLHAAPTPRGGGIVPVFAILLVWISFGYAGWAPAARLAIPFGTLVLTVISWLDDRVGVAVGGRLVVQILVIGLSIYTGVLSPTVFQHCLPPVLDRAATALLWLWFVNLFNFMDGADGLAGSEAATIGAGLTLVTAVGVAFDPATAVLGAAIAAAALGFLVWNWAPARVFMGDAGSVPLGYLLGFLLLRLASEGWWKAALILPLYFLADATITLVRRAVRGERVWQAHREHFYQRAVLRGLSHAGLVRRASLANIVLIGCAWAAENGFGLGALAAAVAVVAILLVALSRPRYTGA